MLPPAPCPHEVVRKWSSYLWWRFQSDTALFPGCVGAFGDRRSNGQGSSAKNKKKMSDWELEKKVSCRRFKTRSVRLAEAETFSVWPKQQLFLEVQDNHCLASAFETFRKMAMSLTFQKSSSASASMRWVPIARFLRKRTDRPSTPTAMEKNDHSNLTATGSVSNTLW